MKKKAKTDLNAARAWLRRADLSFVGDASRHAALVAAVEQIGSALNVRRFGYVVREVPPRGR